MDFTDDDIKTDVSLCNLDVNVTERWSLIAPASLNLGLNSLKENVFLYSKSFFENQMW